jgi:hypothetical protein
MSYKQFKDCGKYNMKLRGDNVVMTPIMAGLEFPNRFQPKNNDIVVRPSVETTNVDFKQLNKAYPQEKID